MWGLRNQVLKPKNLLKSKPSLESMLTEFANAAEFEGRNRKSKQSDNAG